LQSFINFATAIITIQTCSMNRRAAINSVLILSLGAIVLPSYGRDSQPLIKLKNIALTADEENMVMQLSDLIIPKTNFIGAEDVKAHEFVLKMSDDCFDPEKQNKFTRGLKQFYKLAKEKYGQSFKNCKPVQQNEWLQNVEKKKELSDELVFFYETTKRYTLQAFTSSKEYMTDVAKYKMLPGSDFKGCVMV